MKLNIKFSLLITSLIFVFQVNCQESAYKYYFVSDVYQPLLEHSEDLKATTNITFLYNPNISNSLPLNRNYILANVKMAFAIRNNFGLKFNYRLNINNYRYHKFHELNFAFGYFVGLTSKRAISKYNWKLESGETYKNPKKKYKEQWKNEWKRSIGKFAKAIKSSFLRKTTFQLNSYLCYSKVYIENTIANRYNLDLGVNSLTSKISCAYNIRSSLIFFKQYGYDITILDYTPLETYNYLVGKEPFVAFAHNVKINYSTNRFDYFIKYNHLIGDETTVNATSEINRFAAFAIKRTISAGATFNLHNFKRTS